MADSAPPVLPCPSTKGGAESFYHLISAASNNATVVKTSRALVSHIAVCNNAATVSYLKLYNQNTSPVAATDVPIYTILIPIKGTVSLDFGAFGVSFHNGIAFMLVTGMADSDNTGVGVSEVSLGIAYT